jgi:phosphoglycolate phosphatase
MSVSRFLELYDQRLLETTRPYAGVVEALRQLATLGTIAVLTNKPQRPTERLLEELDLARFAAAVVAGDGEFPRKPNPAGLIHLIERFEVDRKQTVMVGDSWIDYSTARSAGTSICLARYGFGFDSFPTAEIGGGEGLVDDPAEFEGVIRRLLDA